MLVLTRRDGDWVRVTHRSGDVLWIRVDDFRAGRFGGRPLCHVGFDDAARNFEIVRAELLDPEPAPEPGADDPTPPRAA